MASLANGILLVPYLLCITFADHFCRLDDKYFARSGLSKSHLTLNITMIRAESHGKVIPSVIGEPFYFSFCVLMADEAANRCNFPIFHSRFLRRELSGNKFFICPVSYQDLLRPGFRRAVGINGKVFTDHFIGYHAEDPCRVYRVVESLVKFTVVLNMQKIRGSVRSSVPQVQNL